MLKLVSQYNTISSQQFDLISNLVNYDLVIPKAEFSKQD